MSEPDPSGLEPRLAQVLEALEALAGGDRDVQLPVSGRQDLVDAIALAVNVLGDELRYVERCRDEALAAERRRAEELAQAKEAAEAANRAKNTFVASISHEIRTPMTAILGFSELLARTRVSSEKRAYLAERIQANGRALLRLIDDLLDISRIEENRLHLETQAVAVVPLVRDVLGTVELQAEKRGLTLELLGGEAGPAAPALRALADPTRLRQILLNLVTNALKFTREGGVAVSAHRDGDAVRIDVRDTGPGLDESEREHVFTPFWQA